MERLDVEHVAKTVDEFISTVEHNWGLNRSEIAHQTVFFSHETYTPARGGSAQSEVKHCEIPSVVLPTNWLLPIPKDSPAIQWVSE